MRRARLSWDRASIDKSRAMARDASAARGWPGFFWMKSLNASFASPVRLERVPSSASSSAASSRQRARSKGNAARSAGESGLPSISRRYSTARSAIPASRRPRTRSRGEIGPESSSAGGATSGIGGSIFLGAGCFGADSLGSPFLGSTFFGSPFLGSTFFGSPFLGSVLGACAGTSPTTAKRKIAVEIQRRADMPPLPNGMTTGSRLATGLDEGPRDSVPLM